MCNIFHLRVIRKKNYFRLNYTCSAMLLLRGAGSNFFLFSKLKIENWKLSVRAVFRLKFVEVSEKNQSQVKSMDKLPFPIRTYPHYEFELHIVKFFIKRTEIWYRHHSFSFGKSDDNWHAIHRRNQWSNWLRQNSAFTRIRRRHKWRNRKNW